MGHVQEKLDAVKLAGETILDLLDHEFTPLSYDDFEITNEEYSSRLSEVSEILNKAGKVRRMEEPKIDDPILVATTTVDESWVQQLACRYRRNGFAWIQLNYTTSRYGQTVLKELDYAISPIQVGSIVSFMELCILVNEFRSTAEALDYWAYRVSQRHHLRNDTNRSDASEDSSRQKVWRESRGVTKQAISNNVNSARKKLDKNG